MVNKVSERSYKLSPKKIAATKDKGSPKFVSFNVPSDKSTRKRYKSLSPEGRESLREAFLGMSLGISRRDKENKKRQLAKLKSRIAKKKAKDLYSRKLKKGGPRGLPASMSAASIARQSVAPVVSTKQAREERRKDIEKIQQRLNKLKGGKPIHKSRRRKRKRRRS